MKKIFYSPIIVVLMLLSACATLGLPTAEKFGDRVALSYAMVAGITSSTTILLNAKKISVDDAENVLAQAKNALVGIGLANSMAKTGMTDAGVKKIDAIHAILLALQAYITTKEQTK